MATMILIFKWVVGGAITTFIGLVIRNLYVKVNQSITRQEAVDLISDKLAPIMQRIQDIRDDQKEIKGDIKKLLEEVYSSRNKD